MDLWLDRLRRELEECTDSLTEADWKRAPQGSWNCAEIVEHLGRSYGGTAKLVEASLAAGATAAAPNLSQRFTQLLVVSLGFFPSGRKAPEFVAPQGKISGPVALERALHGLERMREALDAAEKRWGGRASVGAHFLLGPMSAPHWRKFHYLHGHHHVLQIRHRVENDAG